MKCANIIERLKKKAKQSQCRYQISAIGLDHRGKVIGSACNTPRFSKLGGGVHAEMALMKKSPKSLRTIIICRINPSGDICRIDPCEACKNKADDLGIKITTVT